MRNERWLPASGIVFVALVLASFIGSGSTPGTNASAAKIASFYDTHSTREFVVSVVLGMVAPFAVLFAVSLASAVSGPEGRSHWQVAVVTAGGVVAALFLIVALIHFALADAGNNGLGGSGIQALNALDADNWIGFNAALGLLMLAASRLLVTARAIARPLAWSAFVLGVALFFPYADFFALLLTGIWIITTSIVLLRRPAGGTLAAAATA